MGRHHQYPRVKAEPQLSDSDKGDESDEDTYAMRKPSNPTLDSSQQVNDVLSKLGEHQAAMQDKNFKVMETLVNWSPNAFVLDDIPVFDGLKCSIDFENWLLELDKVVEVTGINISELAFSKSSGTPHKMIKRLRWEKTWEFITEKLQITYSKLATDIDASTDVNQNKQKRHEPLEDFIERFYQNYKQATGEDPARTRNPHVINTFVRNLYNRDIQKCVSGTQLVDLQAAFNSAIKIQRKLKRFEGYEYVSEGDDDDKVVNVLDLNKDGTAKGIIPGLTGAAGIGPCFKCGGYCHLSKDCPSRDRLKDRPNTSYVKTTSGQYIPLQLLSTSPPTLTQQITTQGVITPEAWVKIQEKVNALAENNELIDKKQKTLGQSHQKLKKLTKVIHKNTEQTHSSHTKPHSGKQDDKKDRKKVKFVTPPTSGNPLSKDKQVNVIQTIEEGSNNWSENEGSETPLPDETSISSEESTRAKYFDLLSSSFKDYDSSGNSDNDK